MTTGWDDGSDAPTDDWGDAPEASPAPAADGGWDETEDLGGAADDGTIRLGAKPDAQVLRDALLMLPELGAARIDASEVERLPGPVFQVLLMAMRDALCAGGRIKVINPSFAFGLCFEAFGLGGDLEPFSAEYV